MRRVLTFVLSVAMILTLSGHALAVNDVTIQTEIEEEPVRLKEITELREKNSETYLLSDGTYQCVVHAEDKYFLNADGDYVEIDNTIVKSTYTRGLDRYSYTNKSNSIKYYFSENEPSVLISTQTGGLSFKPVGEVSATAILGSKSKMTLASDSNIIQGDNVITYKNVYESTDFVYSVNNAYIKEYIVLHNTNAPTKFAFEFIAENCKIRENERGIIEIVENNGNVIFELGSLFAVDAAGKYTDELEYTIKSTESGQTVIVVSISEEYIKDANRQYPVIIDPTIMVTGVNTTYDACVLSAYPNTNYYLDTYLRTGRDSDYGYRRSYIKFDIPSAVYSGIISEAYLDLKYCSGATPSISAYKVTEPWESSTIVWSDLVAYDTQVSKPFSYYSSNWYRAYVTSFVRDWAYGYSNNYGFLIKDSVENDNSHWTTFYSSDAASPNKPELYITYSASKYARLIGVDAVDINGAAHDHASCFSAVRTSLMNCDLISTAFIHTGEFTDSQIEGYLEGVTNSVFISRSHGKVWYNNAAEEVQLGTGIVINNDINNEEVFLSHDEMEDLDLSNMTLVLFVGCSTGRGGDGGPNLPTVAEQCGATTAVGFENEIDCVAANTWIIKFAQFMKAGDSVIEACAALNREYAESGLATVVISGYYYTTLN